VGPHKPLEIPQGQVQSPAPGSGQSQISVYRLRDEGIENSPAEKDLGILLDEKLEPAMFCCSPEDQSYPELYKKKHGQQVEGGDSPTLLS